MAGRETTTFPDVDVPDRLDVAGNQALARVFDQPVSESKADAVARRATGTRPQAPARSASSRRRADSAARTDVFRSLLDRGPEGRPIPGKVADDLGPRMGADLSDLRIHDDARSDLLCRSVGARAFAYGNEMHFARGEFAPSTSAGSALLAHESAHALGQTGAHAGESVQMAPGAYTGLDWTQATSVSPSLEGGMGGIMRVTLGGEVHIVKPISDAAGTLISERFVQMIGGAESTDSVLIPKGSSEWHELIGVIRWHSVGHPDQAKQDAFARNMRFYEQAPFLALQRNMVAAGGTDMEQLAHSADPGDVRAILLPPVLRNMGRTLAADTLLGNADRFEAMNTGNAFIMPNMAIGAIDSATIWQSYTGFIKAFTHENTFAPANPITEWTDMLIQGGRMIADGKFDTPPSTDLSKVLTSFDRWFEGSFWIPLYKKLKGDMNLTATAPEDMKLHDDTKQALREGLEDGLQKVDAFLADRNKMVQMKAYMRQLEQQYGQSDSVDWQAFKTRRAYIMSARGGDDPKAARAQADKTAQYMLSWKQKTAQSLSGWDPGYERTYDPPAQLSKREKFKRAMTRNSASKKRAGDLKKQARAGAVDEELLQQVEADAPTDRRRAKALSEVYSRKFLAYMIQRTAAFDELNDTVKQARPLANGAGQKAELATKQIDFAARVKRDPATVATLRKFHQVTDEWARKLGYGPVVTQLIDHRHDLEEAASV